MTTTKQLLCFLIIMPTLCFSQELKKKVSGNEKYYVLKADKKIKQGDYLYKDSNIQINGQYDRNEKSGVWEYLQGSILYQKYDFTNDSLIYDRGFNICTVLGVIKNGNISSDKPDTYPVFIGSSPHYTIITDQLKMPNASFENGVNAKATIAATITSSGKIVDEEIIKGSGYGFNEDALRVIKLLPDEWVPALNDQVPVDTRVIFSLAYNLN